MYPINPNTPQNSLTAPSYPAQTNAQAAVQTYSPELIQAMHNYSFAESSLPAQLDGYSFLQSHPSRLVNEEMKVIPIGHARTASASEESRQLIVNDHLTEFAKNVPVSQRKNSPVFHHKLSSVSENSISRLRNEFKSNAGYASFIEEKARSGARIIKVAPSETIAAYPTYALKIGGEFSVNGKLLTDAAVLPKKFTEKLVQKIQSGKLNAQTSKTVSMNSFQDSKTFIVYEKKDHSHPIHAFTFPSDQDVLIVFADPGDKDKIYTDREPKYIPALAAVPGYEGIQSQLEQIYTDEVFNKILERLDDSKNSTGNSIVGKLFNWFINLLFGWLKSK